VARRALQLAIALCLAGAANAAELALGTLFHSADERAKLDRMRRGETEPAAAAPAPGQSSAVTGFVKRSDGRNTVWIDGTPVSVRGSQGAEVFDPRAVRAYSDRQDDALQIERKKAP
jgi:hypothetical protein